MRLTDRVFLTGHPDMFFEMKPGLFRVVEIKSITGEVFPKLVDALAEHAHQCRTYMWGLQMDKRIPVKIDPMVGYVLYISKKHTTKDIPMKMYPVWYEKAAAHRIEQKLLSYKNGIENFPEMLPPPIEECKRADFNNYRAKTCPARKECLAGR